MPRYDYKCAVGHVIEVSHPASAELELPCPAPVKFPDSTHIGECGEPMTRQFTPSGNFLLKGGGFYSTETAHGRSNRQRDAAENV